MSLLDDSIQELYKIEPYWNMCNPCQCGGYCCIGADVSVSEEEWNTIKEFVQRLSEEDRNILANNIEQNKICVFRSSTKCLIHPVRPENCKYTPYQYMITDDNHLNYSQIRAIETDKKCEYKMVYFPLTD